MSDDYIYIHCHHCKHRNNTNPNSPCITCTRELPTNYEEDPEA